MNEKKTMNATEEINDMFKAIDDNLYHISVCKDDVLRMATARHTLMALLQKVKELIPAK